MTEPSRLQQIFFEVFEALPRQGPGNRASAARALALCTELPASPLIVDLGCGVGAQTLYLAELTNGTIIALDSHAPSIERLRTAVAGQGLATRVTAMAGDMAKPDLPAAHFDVVWSEGALYTIGLDAALGVSRNLLRPGGYLVFTDAVWLRDDPPPEVKAIFEADYPTMGSATDALAAIERAGFTNVGHFTLPDEAWWDDFYTPMLRRIEELRGIYAHDADALAALDQIAQEPAGHRENSAYYAYEYFIARKP